ncbi:alpha/beta fold hydrolase [Phytoactinopolyspora mesophila]|uniref:Alpha/beta fold hydrolase n=1 Tax=Phytoactinopolyspora mesophila TaxID=2650750 RepID=A0A7K3M910_9ACTN|nr:alpha/beta hydrolase [Phytoactinopolyspora mesophila]NDL59763.1 alpha/beta fold hydrolase [Phytoactinopolyspora mesophila]
MLPHTDYGGDGPTILALHGHFGSARTFAGLAAALRGRARVVAVDQRGHGHAPRGGPYTREAYVEDVAGFIRSSGLTPAIVLGHSMGGVTAYQVAAWHPELVRALIVEEGPAVVEPPLLDTRGWPLRAATLRELGRAIEAEGIPDASYFLESAIRYPDGWGLAFDPDEMLLSQELLLGDRWPDWMSVACPTLLLHGTGSNVLSTEHAHDMIKRRPHTHYQEFGGCGHWIHDDDPTGIAAAITTFLAGLRSDIVGER